MEVHNLIKTNVSCHCWNGDRTKLALSPNNNEIHIYCKKHRKWQVEAVLREHEGRVTGLDWAAATDSLVSCGADRNAYVWTYDGHNWLPTLVILKINRAATVVKWSPRENKFAVGNSSNAVCVCHYDKQNNWWVSRRIRNQLKSIVQCLAWHNNNCLLAVGACDFKIRLFSGYLSGKEEKPKETVWGKKMPFGKCLYEHYDNSCGWVHDLDFSPSGNKLAWVSHGSCISVIDKANGSKLTVEKHRYLPYLSCLWLTENSLVCAGYDCYPMLWRHDNDSGNLTYINKLDHLKETKPITKSISAMEKFRALDRKGRGSTVVVEPTISSIHQNTITQLFPLTKNGDSVSKFVTTGVDGKLVVWDCKTLEFSIAGLKI